MGTDRQTDRRHRGEYNSPSLIPFFFITVKEGRAKKVMKKEKKNKKDREKIQVWEEEKEQMRGKGKGVEGRVRRTSIRWRIRGKMTSGKDRY
jgi:hypothetical protein